MAERIEGLSIGLSLDTIKVDAGLKDLRSSMSLLTSEVKANMSQFDYGEKSLKKYQTQVDGLNKKTELQRTITDKAATSYDKMVKEFGEGSVEAEKAAKEYNNQSSKLNGLERAVKKTSDEMAAFKKQQDINESSLKKFGDQAIKTGDHLTKVGEKAKGIGDSLSTKVTLPLLAAGGLLFKQAVDIEGSQARVQNALGLTADQAKKTADVAKTVYKNGWGESLEHVEQAMVSVVEQLGLMDDPEALEDITAKAIHLEEIFGMDMNESLRGANALMTTYGMTADEAFDYLTSGAQNGLDKTDELGDNLAEYATLFEENGYSASEMFNILQAGLDGGAYNLDKVNDLVKEFGVRVGDGTIKDAIADMGGEWGKIYDTWEKSGESNDVLFQKMAENLAAIEDPQKKQAALTEIWGSMGEDAGYKVIEAMGGVEDIYGDVAGSSQDLLDVTSETMGARFTTIMREAADSFLPLGDVLLTLAEEYMPLLEDKVSDLTTALAGMDKETLENTIKWGGLALVIGPAISLFGNLALGIGAIIKPLGVAATWIAGKGGITAALGLMGGKLAGVAAFITGPWGLAALAAATVGTAIFKSMNEEAIPAVAGFGDEVSDTTTQAVNDFNLLHEEASVEMALLFAETTPTTEAGTAKLSELFTSMYTTISEASTQNKVHNVETLSAQFLETGGKIDEGETAILDKINLHYGNRDTALEDLNARQAEIIALATEEKRDLTLTEEQELESINRRMQDMAIKVLSESEQEQLIIKETMKQNKGIIDAQTAADTVKRSKEAREGVVSEATQQYEQRIAAIAYERDVMGSISEEEADKLIEEANKSKEDTVQSATDKHNGVVAEAKAQAKEHVGEVDWETGQVKSKWQVMAENVGQTSDEMQVALKKDFDTMIENVKELPGKISRGWSDAKSAFGSAIADFFNEGAGKAEGGINKIIKGVNSVLDALGSSWSIPTVSLGRVSTNAGKKTGRGHTKMYADGTDSHPGGLAVVGDGGMKELLFYPNGNIALSPDTDTLLDLPKGTQVASGPDTKQIMNSIGVPKYAGGIGGIWEGLKGAGSKLWDWVSKGASSVVNGAFDLFGINGFGEVPSVAGDILDASWGKVKKSITSFVDDKMPDFNFGGTNAPGVVRSWIAQAIARTGVPGSWAGPLTTIAMKESGGNPSAINLWDINAKNGIPSQGLMQTIPGTFNAYNPAGMNNILNPVHNAAAAINYIKSRYGNVFNVPGIKAMARGGAYVGYKDGGIVNEPGIYALAEDGFPEFVIPTDPAKRTDAQKLLAIASKQLSSNKSPQQLSNPATGQNGPSDEVHYHMNLTVQGELPRSTIERMAKQFEEEIKKLEDRRRMSRGEGVSFG